MRYSTKGVLLIMAVLLSLIAVQAPLAAEISSVSGVIEELSTKPNMVVVNGIEIYGVSFNKLEAYNIPLSEGVDATFDVYEYICSSGEERLMAYSVTVGDVTVVLRAIP